MEQEIHKMNIEKNIVRIAFWAAAAAVMLVVFTVAAFGQSHYAAGCEEDSSGIHCTDTNGNTTDANFNNRDGNFHDDRPTVSVPESRMSPVTKDTVEECMKNYAAHPWYVVKLDETGAAIDDHVIDADIACKETK